MARPGATALVLLSGGRDSVACLHWTGAREALHVNYGLRPSADADEALCRRLCERLGVRLHVHRPGPPSGNVQAWAREVRYARAFALAEGDVATGHTATDQVETVLYRLAASPGRRALLGMEGERTIGTADGPRRIVRPLLGWTREDTTAYCRAHGLEWADDPSNDSAAYARNRVRHRLVEALREVHPAAEANVLRTLALLRDEAELLDALAERERTDDVERLRAKPPALRRLLLGPRADEILALTAGSIDLGGGERAVVEHGRVRFTRERARVVEDVSPLAIPGRARFGDGEVRATLGEGDLDAAALRDVHVRRWRDGDRIRLRCGSRSLQDLFTDRKVPRESRRAIPVAVAGGEVAWVAGVVVGAGFAVSASTRERVRLAWHP